MGICDGMPWNVFQFSFYKQLKFRAQLSWAWKKFYNLRGPGVQYSHRLGFLKIQGLNSYSFQGPQVYEKYFILL